MSQQPNGHGPVGDGAARLIVVRVEDAIEPKLTARTGAIYQSPPQPPEQAMPLVRLLLGCSDVPLDGSTRWVTPIAGGRRLITLTEEPAT